MHLQVDSLWIIRNRFKPFLQFIDRSLPFTGIHFIEILLFPTHCRESFNFRMWQQAPVGLTAFETKQKVALIFRHAGNDPARQCMLYRLQRFKRDFFFRQTSELAVVQRFDIFDVRAQAFVDRLTLTDQINDEYVHQLGRQFVLLKEYPCVEQISWMLSIQRSTQLACVDFMLCHAGSGDGSSGLLFE